MKISWNPEKNELLKKTRHVSFEQVEDAVAQGAFLGPRDNPARKGQKILTIILDGYPCIVPFVEEEDGGWFLKTIFQSRKEKRRLENGV